jgi:hypothetical protein
MDLKQDQRRLKGRKMKGFLFGVIVTLAVLNPQATKTVLSKAVDVSHQTLSDILDQKQ